MQSYENLLEDAGAMGPWQMWTCGWVWLSQFFQAMTNMAIVFMQFEPTYRCISHDFGNSTDQCTGVDRTLIESGNNESAVETRCTEWSYDRSVMTQTLVTEWDFVCEKTVRVADAQSVFMAGFFFGALLSGLFSDRFGRRTVVVISGTLTAVMGVAQSQAPTFSLLLVCRFLLSVANTACYSTAFVLCMETTTGRYRDWVGGMFYIPYALGYTALSGFAYFIRDWRTLQLVISLPVAINALYWWLLPESPRWLLSEGHTTEAYRILKTAAKWNGNTGGQGKLKEDSVSVTTQEESVSGESLLDMVKYPRMLLRCLLMCIVWFVTSMVYYGVSLNVTAFTGNLFVNNAIFGAVELPGYLLCVPLLWWGRKRAVSATLFVVGGALLAIQFMQGDLIWARLPLAMLGKLAVTATFAIIFVHTTEMFPTVMRDTGLGVCNSAARIGSMLAPYVSLFANVAVEGVEMKFMSMVVYGVASLLAGCVALFLPETRDAPMPGTFKDAIGDVSSLASSEEEEKIAIGIGKNDEKPMEEDTHMLQV